MATSHYQNQCWSSPPMPYGIIRLQWVNSWRPSLAHIINMLQLSGSSLFDASPLPEMLTYCDWTFRNKVQWNFTQNSNIFIQENVSEYVVCKMAAMLFWPQCELWVNWVDTSHQQSVTSGHTCDAHFNMMTSSNGNIFRVTGHLCVEFTGDRWIPCTKASDEELWCFLWSAPEWTVE